LPAPNTRGVASEVSTWQLQLAVGGKSKSQNRRPPGPIRSCVGFAPIRSWSMSMAVQVFGCRDAEPIHARRRPASEKRQGTKSRWVGWRGRGLYGELRAASGSKRMRRSGRAHGLGRRRGCACRAKRADRGIDRNGAGDAGESDGPTRVEAMPIEIRRGWLISLRWRIGGDGIMRCRSRLPPARVSVGAWARSRARRSR
jgi:hypothetical protein